LSICYRDALTEVFGWMWLARVVGLFPLLLARLWVLAPVSDFFQISSRVLNHDLVSLHSMRRWQLGWFVSRGECSST
jgi:hypothetical protein